MNNDELNDYVEWHKSGIVRYGFVCHAVQNEEITDIHTHGLNKNRDQPELQCVAPLPTETIFNIFHEIVNRRAIGNFETHDICQKIAGFESEILFVQKFYDGTYVDLVIIASPPTIPTEVAIMQQYSTKIEWINFSAEIKS